MILPIVTKKLLAYMPNPALDAIFWALENHIEAPVDNATTLFLRARASAELHEIANLTCV